MNKKHRLSCRRALSTFLFILLPSSLILTLTGCTILGAVAGKVVPEPVVEPSYAGFADQSIAVMVWAGDGTLIDFPDVRLDLAGSIQKKLTQARDVKTKQLANISFPTTPAAIVRFQDNRPEYETRPITEVAPKLGASRVIYVEVEDLQTRSAAAVELYRGSASASVKVIEVPPGAQAGAQAAAVAAAPAASARVAFEESGVAAVFPPNAREEGSPNGSDRVIYHGLIDALSSEIAKRFVPHLEEQ